MKFYSFILFTAIYLNCYSQFDKEIDSLKNAGYYHLGTFYHLDSTIHYKKVLPDSIALSTSTRQYFSLIVVVSDTNVIYNSRGGQSKMRSYAVAGYKKIISNGKSYFLLLAYYDFALNSSPEIIEDNQWRIGSIYYSLEGANKKYDGFVLTVYQAMEVIVAQGSIQQISADRHLTINLLTESIDTTLTYQLDTLINYPTKILITLCNFSSDTIYIDKIRGDGQVYTDKMDKILIPPNTTHNGIYALHLRSGPNLRHILFHTVSNGISRKLNVRLIGYKT